MVEDSLQGHDDTKDEVDTTDERLRAFYRAAATEQRQALAEVRSAFQQEAASLSRWLTASLLAINSGAIIAILNASEVSVDGKLYGGALFAAGILFALLIAYSNLKLAHHLGPEVQKHLGYWIAVNLDGERDEEMEKELEIGWKSASKYRLAPDLIGWVSLFFFLGGLAAVGFDLRDQVESASQIESAVSDVRSE